MAHLTRDQILAAPDLPREEVDVPEWGGSVLVSGLSGTDRDAFEASIVEVQGSERKMDLENIRAKLVARSIVDDAGQRLFSDADVRKLGAKSAVALQRVFEVAQRLSGLTPADVKELAKN